MSMDTPENKRSSPSAGLRESEETSPAARSASPTIPWRRLHRHSDVGPRRGAGALEDVDAVRQAVGYQKVKGPSGFEITMDAANHHLHKPVASARSRDGQFKIVWKTPVRSARKPGARSSRRAQEGRRLDVSMGLRQLHRAEFSVPEKRSPRRPDGRIPIASTHRRFCASPSSSGSWRAPLFARVAQGGEETSLDPALRGLVSEDDAKMDESAARIAESTDSANALAAFCEALVDERLFATADVRSSTKTSRASCASRRPERSRLRYPQRRNHRGEQLASPRGFFLFSRGFASSHRASR